MKKLLLMSLAVLAGLVVLAALFVSTGLYNVAADAEHSALVFHVMETARDRSIATRAASIDVPDLGSPERVRRGAGNYDSMCAGCHRKPGARETELSRGLYPSPPELTRASSMDPARAFWVIKHGIKATAMPAWGRSMEDSYIWDMVAFLERLPQMNAEQYRAEVRASGGHSHGGGETMEEGHESGEEGHSHAEEEEGGESGHSHSGDGHSQEATGTDQRLAHTASKDPIAVVQAFHAALSAGNADRVEALLDHGVLIMEGGNVERSRKEYASHHLPSDLKFMSAVRYALKRQTGDTVGDLAWVASEATLTNEPGGKAVDLVSTESLVLRKGASGWKIVHIHWSSRTTTKA